MWAIPVGRFRWYEIEANHVQELSAESPHSADPLAGTGSPLLVGVGPERLRLEQRDLVLRLAGCSGGGARPPSDGSCLLRRHGSRTGQFSGDVQTMP